MPRIKLCVKEGKGQVGLVDYDLPDPQPGEALIRTTLTTICGSDLHMVDSYDDLPAGWPQGHEAVGIVEAIGEGVERVAVGDRVVASCAVGCGQCRICRLGDTQLCEGYGAPMNTLFGAQAEAFLVRAADLNLARIPDSLDDRHALLTTDMMSTGFAAIERGNLQPGQTVVLFAQGPVGLCATAAARHHGAGRIIAVDAVPERRQMAQRFGADDTLEPEGAVERILELTGGLGADLAVEALGQQLTFDNCVNSTRIGGTVSSVGIYAGLESLTIPVGGPFVQRSFVFSFCPNGSERLAYLMGLLDGGKVDVSPLLTHDHALADIAPAYDLFRDRRDGVLKIAIAT